MTAIVSTIMAVFEFLQNMFHAALAPIFHPLNTVLGGLPNWVASVFGVGLFVMAMIWVGVFLKKDYVNYGRPHKSIWTDLRLWTCLSMMPHVIFYLYFR
ncbi:MAG TPA: hypothetical protein VMZ06_13895 [Candidatus Bathyarchaeia archaeon]|nr:hypothetical protein [Candidatus Bathyarchaeia archaeon]